MHVFNLILVLDEINSGELDINGKNISSVSTGCPKKVEFCFQIQILERISGSKPIVYSRLKVYIFNQFCLDRLSIKYELVSDKLWYIKRSRFEFTSFFILFLFPGVAC